MRKAVVMVALMGVLASMLSGCGVSANTVSTDGSTSMEKVIGALGEAFENENADVSFTYNPTGSGAGITAVAENRCDIGLSSRSLTVTEKELGLQETVLAYDGIAVIVHPDNPIENLDMETLAAIYTGEITNWQELGGHDGEIVPIGREANSGTRDGFEQSTDTEGRCQYRQELTSTGDVITITGSNPNAIGYASLASVKDSVRVVAVDEVLPSARTIQEGSYGIQRPFVLVTNEKVQQTEAASRFLAFCLSEEGKQLITKAGFIPAE